MHTESNEGAKKRVAFVISSLRMGGAEKVASLLANFCAEEYEVVLILWNPKEAFYELRKDIQVRVISNRTKGIFGNLYKIFALVRIFRDCQIDLVVSFIHQSNILSILAARFARVPVIATEHSIYESLGGFWKILRRWVYPLATCTTTLTHGDLKNYAFLSNMRIMPNPITLIKQETPAYKCHQPYILSAGRMIASKHFEELLESFFLFSQTHKGYSLLIAGDGVLKESLQTRAKELGIRVVFLGQVQNLYSAYCCAEFFALTSHREGLSNVLIESLMCGTPVVSYDCPYGPGEIIRNGENGFLVELGNVQVMAESFEKVLLSREILSKNAQKSVERFREENVLKQWKMLINEHLVLRCD